MRRVRASKWYRIEALCLVGAVTIGAVVVFWTLPATAPVDGTRLGTYTDSASTSRQLPTPATPTVGARVYSKVLTQNVPTVVVTPASDQRALGIAAGSSLTSLSDTQLADRLNGMVAAGARWIRFDVDWGQIQPKNAQEYNWSAYDRLVVASNARHLKILGILTYTPAWARQSACSGTDKCAPADPAQFASFATAVARRYSPQGVHYWEVWNEPNSRDFWQPASSPAQYTNLLRDAYTALHAADSSAYVITGGLSPQATADGSFTPYDFLAGIYASGAQGYFEAVADHPYTFPLSPADDADDAWTQMARSSHSLRSLMVSNNDASKKIWITEFGSPTGGPGPVSTNANPNLDAHPYVVDQDRQAKLLSDAVALYKSYDWAGPLLYYSYQDAGTDPSTNENFFGLITYDGSQKPAYGVFQTSANSF